MLESLHLWTVLCEAAVLLVFAVHSSIWHFNTLLIPHVPVRSVAQEPPAWHIHSLLAQVSLNSKLAFAVPALHCAFAIEECLNYEILFLWVSVHVAPPYHSKPKPVQDYWCVSSYLDSNWGVFAWEQFGKPPSWYILSHCIDSRRVRWVVNICFVSRSAVCDSQYRAVGWSSSEIVVGQTEDKVRLWEPAAEYL